jgi:hypothetical protein
MSRPPSPPSFPPHPAPLQHPDAAHFHLPSNERVLHASPLRPLFVSPQATTLRHHAPLACQAGQRFPARGRRGKRRRRHSRTVCSAKSPVARKRCRADKGDTTLIREVARSSCQRDTPDSATRARSKSAQEGIVYTGRQSHKSVPRALARSAGG